MWDTINDGQDPNENVSEKCFVSKILCVFPLFPMSCFLNDNGSITTVVMMKVKCSYMFYFMQSV